MSFYYHFKLIFVFYFASSLIFLLAPFITQAVESPLNRPALRVQEERISGRIFLDVALAGTRLVAVGERGLIALSDNNGMSWRQADVPASVTLTAVCFATPLKGWVVGHAGIVLHSRDGGETWEKQLDGRQAAELALEAARNRTQQGPADPEFARQLDSAQLLVDDGPDKPFFDIYFEDDQNGFIAGAYNLFFRTGNGGKTWQPWMNHVENPGELHLYEICRNGDDLYMAGEQGLFLRSSDGGNSFTALSMPYNGSFFGLLCYGDGQLVVFGLRGNAFYSEDRGANWQNIVTGMPVSVTGGIVVGGKIPVLINQGGAILKSCDQGRTFENLPIEESTYPFTGIVQATDGSLVLAGVRGMMRIDGNQIICGSSGRVEGEH